MIYKNPEGLVQSDCENRLFRTFLQTENVKSYLEIGSQWGGSLWQAATAMPIGSRIVTIDNAGLKELRQCCLELNQMGYDVHACYIDSHSPFAVEFARKLSPFDMCFIDADHVYDSVSLDWQNYGPMARLVGFHDIISYEGQMGVAKLWNEIKFGYCYEEFMDDPPLPWYGIGVLIS